MTCMIPTTHFVRDEAPKSIPATFAECLSHFEWFIDALRDAGTMPLWDPACAAWAEDIDRARDALAGSIADIRGQSPVHPADVRLQTSALVLDIVLMSAEPESVIGTVAGGQQEFCIPGNDLRSRESRVLIARFVELLDVYADLHAGPADLLASIREVEHPLLSDPGVAEAMERTIDESDAAEARRAGRLH